VESQPAGQSLVENGRFQIPGDDEPVKGWTVWRPGFRPNSCDVRRTDEGLLMESPGRPFAVGGVNQQIPGVKPGSAYRIVATCQLRNVLSPYRSVMVRVNFLKSGRLIHPSGMLVRGPMAAGELVRFDDVLVAPEGTEMAEIWLEVKWLQGGSVLWKEVSLVPCPPPAPRRVKIGTVYLRPRESTPEKNLELFAEKVIEAGELGLDIVCLPEVLTVVGTGKKSYEVAEPIPGPATERLGKAAREARVWVVAGLSELDGETMYNTAVLLDREGKLAGKYRKVHLPREEWKEGVSPGHEYPVFETDFGKVAIQICYDWFFPESHEIFALRGAEIIFAPTWGDTSPEKDGMVFGETVFRVRARDFGIYLVPSVYDGSSMVIDPMGRILVSNQGKSGLFWCEVDLNQREPWPWVGYWRSIGPRDRMPHTYGDLTSEMPGPNY